MDEGITPTAWPISQMSHLALSRESCSPNTAARTSASISSDARAASFSTVTRPSSTLIAPLISSSCIDRETRRGTQPRQVPSTNAAFGGGFSNEPARITRRQRFEFIPGGVGTRSSEKPVCELLAQLDSRLIEGVHPIELSGIRSCDLEQHDQPSYMPFVDSLKSDREVRPPPLCERAGGRTLLDVD